MAAVRSFEYGRDISLLKSALRFAERVLQQEDASQTLFSSDHSHSRTAALTVSDRIQNAYSADIEWAVTSSRLHTAVFVNVLQSSDVVGAAELEYFESVLDDLPRIGWPFFAELVSACGWREHFIETLKALSPKIRLRVLEAVHNISKTLPYIWSCTVSTVIWSSCISPIKGIDTSKDEVLSAFSNLQALPSSNEASPTEECLLEDTGLKDFVMKWDHEGVDSTVCDEDTQISVIESILKQGAMPLTSAFTIWIVSHESLLMQEGIFDILNGHLNLLSHPELFHCLFQAALCSDADTFVKKLVLKVCSAAPLKLQEAMLFYTFSSESFSDDSSPLKLTDFENLLTEKLNLVSDADHTTDLEGREQIFSEFASLCLQSPSEVLAAVVEMAVTDGCTTAVSQLLMHLRIVCQHKEKLCNTEQDLLGSIILDTFQRLQNGTSKHQDNFMGLINELVGHSDVVNCDWFLTQIVDCVDMFDAADPCLDSFFPLQVSLAIAPKISEHYIVPMARILVQMLDEACMKLDGARKQKVLHFLHDYLSLDACVPSHRGELVLLDAKKWSSECQKVASQFPECSLTELLMPHFCLVCLKGTKELPEEDLREIVLALVFALSSLPSQCLKQELLLLVDVAQFKKTSVLGGELVEIFREALATQCFQNDFVSGVVKASVHKLLAHQAN
ncbi:hypothetical protein MTO96_003723 [Rhipicephalus appendiculatus]